MQYKKYIKFLLLAILISVLFYYIVDIENFYYNLVNTDYEYILLGFAVMGGSILFKSLGWKILFTIDSKKSPSLAKLYVYTLGGLGAKYIIPGGTLTVQPLISKALSDTTKYSSEDIFARITVGDFLLVLPIGIGVLFSTLYVFQTQITTTYLVLFFVLVLLLGVFYKYRITLLTHAAKIIPSMNKYSSEKINITRLIHRIQSYLRKIFESVNQIKTKRYKLFAVFVCGILSALFLGVTTWMSALAFGIDISVFGAIIVGLGAQGGRIVPIPGGIGSVDATGVAFLLALTTISTGTAISVILLFRIISFWSVMFVGSLIASYIGVSVGTTSPKT